MLMERREKERKKEGMRESTVGNLMQNMSPTLAALAIKSKRHIKAQRQLGRSKPNEHKTILHSPVLIIVALAVSECAEAAC